MGTNGKLMFQLACKHFATDIKFRGKVLVSVREYYKKDGNFIPDKKSVLA